MFNVYNAHGSHMTILPREETIDGVRAVAEGYARCGHDALIRAFRVTGPNTERFEVAYSVLGGVVREHPDVTIPSAHWR